jgi:phytoene synthase
MRPPSPDAVIASQADIVACKALIRGGSRTFHAASLLLPRHIRDAACMLYAFCRSADDAVDRLGAGREALALQSDRVARAYEGRPYPTAADRALADVVARFRIPRALPEALIEGFAWDAERRRYESIAELSAYATRVAGSVGAMMAILMGARDPDQVARACDLGIAMQLSNVARDVGEDAAAGRLYLPLAWLREAGIDPDSWMARPLFNPAVASVVRRVIEAADRHYRRADAGIATLPMDCRPSIAAARVLYAAIGDEVARRGYDSVSGRAVVPARRKAWLLARTLGGQAALMLRSSAAGRAAPASPEAVFLIEAVRHANLALLAQLSALRLPARSLDEKVAWLVDLCEQLDQRQRLRPQER